MGVLGSGGGSKDKHVEVERSHQKGVDLMESAYAVVIAWTVWSCKQRKFERLQCLRWRCHMDQKSGRVMVGGVEDEGETTVPQVMGPALAVSIEVECADVESSGGYGQWVFCGGE
jgi:hypothetical protein